MINKCEDIVILGAPGSGKGTQAKLLCSHFGLNHFVMSDVLRFEINSGSSLGKIIDDSMKRGELLGNELISDLFTKYIDKINNVSCLFDGMPRSIEQAIMLRDLLKTKGRSVK